MDWLTAFAPYAPLFQTFLWVAVLTAFVLLFRSQISGVAGAVRRRVESGSSLKAGPVELGEDLRDLKYIETSKYEAIEPSDEPKREEILKPEDREAQRAKIYEDHRGVFLAHLIKSTLSQSLRY